MRIFALKFEFKLLKAECNISIYFACILDNELNMSQRTKYQYGENVIKRVCFVKSTQSKCK